MRSWVLLALCFCDFSEGLKTLLDDAAILKRIVGGSVTTIEMYPSVTALLWLGGDRAEHICGGTIINERHILTAGHCIALTAFDASLYLIRVGSSMAHSGGTTHRINRVIVHPKWNWSADNDVAILRTATIITYSETVQPACIAGSRYLLRDDETVWAVGWGLTAENGKPSEQLRHVNVLTVNSDECRRRYKNRNITITENMVCTGYLDVGGRDQCIQDSGSPVYHYNTVVGLSSMGFGCGRPCYPGINVKVSSFSNWIKVLTN